MLNFITLLFSVGTDFVLNKPDLNVIQHLQYLHTYNNLNNLKNFFFIIILYSSY